MANTDDVFKVFISHKHDDHALAVEVKKALEGLARPKLIDCFVSGIDITAGMDWRREIRSRLAESHLLVLLFTVKELGLVPLRDRPVLSLRKGREKRGQLGRVPVQPQSSLAEPVSGPPGRAR